MDTQLLKLRIKDLYDYASFVDKEIKPLNFYPATCMKLLIMKVAELQTMVDEEDVPNVRHHY